MKLRNKHYRLRRDSQKARSIRTDADNASQEISGYPVEKDIPVIKNASEDLKDEAIIFKSEMDFISKCILDYPHIETGGELFGYWTATGVPVVLYAIGPGPHANHQTSFFNQDINYLHQIGSVIVNRFGLHHIGEWHSHHQLGLAQPSGHDAQTMIRSIRNHRLNRFLCCIGNCTNEHSTLNAFNFTENDQYCRAEWKIIDLDSPFRSVIDAYLGDQLTKPRTASASYVSHSFHATSPKAATPVYPEGYWLNEKSNRVILKSFLDIVANHNPSLETSVNLDSSRIVHIVSDGSSYHEDILFDLDFPHSGPSVSRVKDGEFIQIKCPEWVVTEDLITSFASYYSNIQII